MQFHLTFAPHFSGQRILLHRHVMGPRRRRLLFHQTRNTPKRYLQKYGLISHQIYSWLCHPRIGVLAWKKYCLLWYETWEFAGLWGWVCQVERFWVVAGTREKFALLYKNGDKDVFCSRNGLENGMQKTRRFMGFGGASLWTRKFCLSFWQQCHQRSQKFYQLSSGSIKGQNLGQLTDKLIAQKSHQRFVKIWADGSIRP